MPLWFEMPDCWQISIETHRDEQKASKTTPDQRRSAFAVD